AQGVELVFRRLMADTNDVAESDQIAFIIIVTFDEWTDGSSILLVGYDHVGIRLGGIPKPVSLHRARADHPRHGLFRFLLRHLGPLYAGARCAPKVGVEAKYKSGVVRQTRRTSPHV